MTLNAFSKHGRTLLVRFTCRRCKIEVVDELEAHKDDDRENYGNLHHIRPPKGWSETYGVFDLLCPSCTKAFVKFMNNEKEANT